MRGPHTVYELKTATGDYVGVTCRPLRQRLIELRSRRGFDGKIQAIAVFEAREDALRLEHELRPDYFMGLNRGRGGRCGMTPAYGAASGKAVPVRINGVEYPSAIEAAKAVRVSSSCMNYRLNSLSKKFTEWTYATPLRGLRSGATIGGRHP